MTRHRRTLLDLLRADIARTDDRGPDWRTAVEDAVLRQDMEWVRAQRPINEMIPSR